MKPLVLRQSEEFSLARFAKLDLAPVLDEWILRYWMVAAAEVRVRPEDVPVLNFLAPNPRWIHFLKNFQFNHFLRQFVSLGETFAFASKDVALFEVGLSVSQNSLYRILEQNNPYFSHDETSSNALSKLFHQCRLQFHHGYWQARHAIEEDRTYSLARALKKSERIRFQEEVLEEILRQMSSYLQFEDLFRVFVHSLRRVLSFDRASVTIRDHESGHLRVVAVSQDNPTEIGVHTVVEAPSAQKALLTRQVQWVDDLVAETSCAVHRKLLQEGIRSFVSLPLLWRGEGLGTLNIGAASTNFFDRDQLPFLQRLANALAVGLKKAIEHKEILDELNTEKEYCEIFSSLLQFKTKKSLLDFLTARLTRLYQVDRAAFAEVQKDEITFLVQSETIAPGVDVPPGSGLHLMEHFKGLTDILKTGKAFATHVEGEVHSAVRPSQHYLKQFGIKTLCLIPLFVSGKYWGALGLSHCRRQHTWKNTEIQRLQKLINNVSNTIEQFQVSSNVSDTFQAKFPISKIEEN